MNDLIPLAITLIASLAVVLVAREVFGYLRSVDDRHYQERRELITRIQTPEYAPMLAATPEEPDDTVGYSEEREVLAVIRGEAE